MSSKLPPGAADALRQLDIHLNPIWQLGRNAVVAWTPAGNGLKLLVSPVRNLLALTAARPVLLRGPRFRDEKGFAQLAADTGLEPVSVITSLKVGTADYTVSWQTVEGVVRRYSISETPHRAVALFDIVGYSKLSPMQQVGQLNALECAINATQRRLTDWNMPLELGRSTTGDGFYLWNRAVGILPEVTLMLQMLLTLAEIETERSRDRHRLVPWLRAAYAVGSHYAYYQVEGLSPRAFEYIVGDVTITLARLIAKAGTGQIMIGAFERPARDDGEGAERLTAPDLVARADARLRRLVGRDFDGAPISEVKLRLSSERGGGGVGGGANSGASGPTTQVINDKHGMEHIAYNAMAQIMRGGRPPIILGASVTPPVEAQS